MTSHLGNVTEIRETQCWERFLWVSRPCGVDASKKKKEGCFLFLSFPFQLSAGEVELVVLQHAQNKWVIILTVISLTLGLTQISRSYPVKPSYPTTHENLYSTTAVFHQSHLNPPPCVPQWHQRLLIRSYPDNINLSPYRDGTSPGTPNKVPEMKGGCHGGGKKEKSKIAVLF